MKYPPLVSVLMPVYNGEAYIRETIDSILAQTFRDFEFIIVNDGSTDDTELIIDSYRDQRIRYYRNSRNKGLINTLNLGIQLSRGEYIARIDADDIADEGRLKKQLEFLLHHPDHGMCGTFYKVINEKGEVIDKVELPTSDSEANTFLGFGNCFCHSSIMIKASLIRELRYRDEYQVCEDYDLWYRAARKTKVSNLPVFATRYRVHGKNVSLVKKDKQDRKVALINRNFLEDKRIPFTADELELHTHFLRFDDGYFSANGKFRELEQWLIKLGDHLRKDRMIHQQLAHTIIIRRWITICTNARRPDLLMANRLLIRYGFFYFRCFYNKVMDKVTRRNPGYDL